MWNPVNSEDIAIFCHNIIIFIRITPVRNNLALERRKMYIYLCCDLLIFILHCNIVLSATAYSSSMYWDRIKQENQDNLKRILNCGGMHAKHGWGKVGWLSILGSPGLLLSIHTNSFSECLDKKWCGHLMRKTTGDSVVS